jgi:hypothetical protein
LRYVCKATKIQLDGTSSSWQSLHILSKRYVLRRSIELTGRKLTLSTGGRPSVGLRAFTGAAPIARFVPILLI